jgi:hypothetical protein
MECASSYGSRECSMSSTDRHIPPDEAIGNPQLVTAMMPVFQQYKQENESWIPDFDTWSYLNLRADADLAAAFTKLFWPDFVEVEGCVLLKRAYSPESFQEWMERFQGDERRVEATMNHVHIWDVFIASFDRQKYPDELYEYLANALIFGWKQALSLAFPDKRFVFTLRHGYGPEISFRQAELLTTG